MYRSLRPVCTVAFAFLMINLAGNSPSASPLPDRASTHARIKQSEFQWRAFRTVWACQVRRWNADFVADMQLSGGKLLYSCNSRIACLNKVTGKEIWSYLFSARQRITKDQSGGYSQGDGWKLAILRELVYAVNNESTTIVALNIATGLPAWERTLPGPAAGAPVPVDGAILVPIARGVLVALNGRDGNSLWSKQFPSSGNGLTIRASGKTIAVHDGGSRLRALDVRTGAQLWECFPEGPKEGRIDIEFAIRNGVCYTETSEHDLAAFDLATGARNWSQNHLAPVSLNHNVAIVGDSVIMRAATKVAKLLPGNSVWQQGRFSRRSDYSVGPFTLPWKHDTGSTVGGLAVFDVERELPYLSGKQRQYHALDTVWTLVMHDGATGAPKWKWQADDGLMISKAVSDGETLFVSDDESIEVVKRGYQKTIYTVFSLSTMNKPTRSMAGPLDHITACRRHPRRSGATTSRISCRRTARPRESAGNNRYPACEVFTQSVTT